MISDEFIGNIIAGDRSTIAKAISMIERDDANARTLIDKIRCHRGGANKIGITGPPGVGKSTLIAKLAQHYRMQDRPVAIIAIDPSSPFSGGAVLGDRIRMDEIVADPGIFIRSMATRGSRGGLNRCVREVLQVMEAAGFAYIFIESVGVGQIEVEIKEVADTTIVVLMPGSGDEVQGIKAGLMEIGDIYVLNKANLPGSSAMLNMLQSLHGRKQNSDAWLPQIVSAIATETEGISEIAAQIALHSAYKMENKR